MPLLLLPEKLPAFEQLLLRQSRWKRVWLNPLRAGQVQLDFVLDRRSTDSPSTTAEEATRVDDVEPSLSGFGVVRSLCDEIVALGLDSSRPEAANCRLDQLDDWKGEFS